MARGRVSRISGAGAILLALGAAGCGKGNLISSHETTSTEARVARSPPAHAAAPRRVPRLDEPLPKLGSPPTAVQAAAFGRAVNLRLADVPGAHASRRSTNRQRAQEARECEGGTTLGIGGSESLRFTRGKGLAREVISSGVAVLASERAARKDLRSVTSRAGIACYAEVVKRSLGREENGLRLAALHVARLQVPLAGALHGNGIRVSMRITEIKTGISIPLFIDALVFVHQAAELELYASSYVQPEPERTEQQLLGLMEQRARLSKL